MSTYKKKQLAQPFRQANWSRHVGNKSESLCFTGCGKLITTVDFECGHIIAESRGGAQTHDNIVPICTPCNRSMGFTSMYEYCTSNNYKLLIDSSHVPSIESAPQVSLNTPVKPFDVHQIDVDAILSRYKNLSTLDNTLCSYIATLRKRCLKNGEFQCDNKFTYDLLTDFLYQQFNSSYLNYYPSQVRPGDGQNLIKTLLHHIKNTSRETNRIRDLENNINTLDKLLIEYIKTIQICIPKC
jgi:hypothetical protein